MGHDVFISYSSKDKPIADGVCATLERNGLRCWMAPRDILPGADWGASIVEAIGSSRAFVLVLSTSANASPQIKREVERAVHHAVPIVPYRIEDVVPTASLEYFLSTPHWLDAFTPPVERHAQSLADALNRLLGIGEAPSPAPASRTPPAAPKSAALPRVALLGGAAALALVVAIGGYFTLRGPQPAPGGGAASGRVVTTASATLADFAGSWNSAKVTWADGVSAGYAGITLGELFAAVMNANRTGGTMIINASGGYQMVIELDDTGTVAPASGGFVFTSSDGATAPVHAKPMASGVAYGSQPDEAGLLLQGVRRLPETWIGTPDPAAAGGPLAGVAGTWRNGAWPVMPDGELWTGKLTIAANGAYTIQFKQAFTGVMALQGGGQFTTTSVAPGTATPIRNGGGFAFNGPDQVSMTEPQGTTLWVRAK
jgi:hypothetical protein